VIDVNTIYNMESGWRIISNAKGQERYEEKKKEKTCTVGILGNFKKGKSFL
jgi:hypothetical protein